MHKYVLQLFFLLMLSAPLHAAERSDEIRVAVASNFLLPLKSLARIYEQETGEKIVISAGSTGKLYAQIINGAPYDVFLAANSREPERLEKEGFAISGSRFTYARGKLALWSPNDLYDQHTLEDVLKAGNFKRLSVANPSTAPYGAAALEVLKKLELEKSSRFKTLRGENVSQAYQYVATGAADLGFVALSQLNVSNAKPQGSYWIVDENMYAPILQQTVLLKSARQKKSSQSFLNYLKSSEGQAMIENFGYGVR